MEKETLIQLILSLSLLSLAGLTPLLAELVNFNVWSGMIFIVTIPFLSILSILSAAIHYHWYEIGKEPKILFIRFLILAGILITLTLLVFPFGHF